MAKEGSTGTGAQLSQFSTPLTSQTIQPNQEGTGSFELKGTKTAFHFLAHDWKTLTVTFKDCLHSLTISSNGNDDEDSNGAKCRSEETACVHNKAVIVPTRLLNLLSPQSLKFFCVEQEKLLHGHGSGHCDHNNSRNKLVVSVENISCQEPCTRILECGHRCRKKCHENCFNSICQETVEVPNQLCRDHLTVVKCGELAAHKPCQVLVAVPGLAGCGHIVRLPCSRRYDATYDELLASCSEPCAFTGPCLCKNSCQGTCGSCHQGRFHVRCSVLCTKILDCGHRCDSVCCSQWTNDVCPPCQKPCEILCEHGTCPKMCGEPCYPCRELCVWECKHFKCSKLCSEICDRELCRQPCEKVLPCGCYCIGYCGEPCPPLCRSCDKDAVSSILLTGNELEEFRTEDRFIFLKQCKHTLEYTALERIMSLDTNHESEARPKTCPLCRRGIWDCRPFNRQIFATRERIMDLKFTSYGEIEEIHDIQTECLLRLSISDRVDGHQTCTFKSFRTYLLKSFVIAEMFITMPKYQTEQILFLVTTVLEAERRGQQLFCLMWNKGYNLYMHYVDRLFMALMTRQLPMLPSEHLDFNRELARIWDLFILVTSPQGDSVAEDSDYMQALDVLEDPGAYTKRLRIEFHLRFRRHWIKFCCVESDTALATTLYEAQMQIKELNINWEEDDLRSLAKILKPHAVKKARANHE